MARGSEGKARKKSERKEKRNAESNSSNPFMEQLDDVDENDGKVEKYIEEDKDDASSSTEEEPIKRRKPKSSISGIKTAPLIMLLILTGTTLLPALLYMGDWFGKVLQKQSIMGSIGYKLGIGPSPKRRVISFYEKHDPIKIPDVPSTLARYYGDYPKLIKRLERKYGDYGYFLNWQEDEAASRLAKVKLYETYDTVSTFIDKQFTTYAPKFLRQRVRNVRYNLNKLYRKGKRIWKKTVWPLLEPIFGVPKGGSAQKRKDRKDYSNEKNKNKNKGGKHKFRDEDEF